MYSPALAERGICEHGGEHDRGDDGDERGDAKRGEVEEQRDLHLWASNCGPEPGREPVPTACLRLAPLPTLHRFLPIRLRSTHSPARRAQSCPRAAAAPDSGCASGSGCGAGSGVGAGSSTTGVSAGVASQSRRFRFGRRRRLRLAGAAAIRPFTSARGSTPCSTVRCRPAADRDAARDHGGSRAGRAAARASDRQAR